MNKSQSCFTEANGIRVHYLRGGAGPTLILLHGWPEWSHVWRPVMSRLADEFDVIAPDFRGFGDSQKSSLTAARDATLDALATDILALVDGLELELRDLLTTFGEMP